MPTVWVIHGPNLNLLGEREVEVYGPTDLETINRRLQEMGRTLGLDVSCRQSNHEGTLVDWIHEARQRADALILNPGGLSHTSVVLLDALRAFPGVVVEVHLSNLWRREPYRHTLRTAGGATGVIAGFGPLSYELALHAVARMLAHETGR